jgi:hypothetical protein
MRAGGHWCLLGRPGDRRRHRGRVVRRRVGRCRRFAVLLSRCGPRWRSAPPGSRCWALGPQVARHGGRVSSPSRLPSAIKRPAVPRRPYGMGHYTRRRPPSSTGAALTDDVRRRPTLPRGPPRSTIGAEGLNFRVRNGTGCFPFAMATETLWRFKVLHACGSQSSADTADRTSGTAQWTQDHYLGVTPQVKGV